MTNKQKCNFILIWAVCCIILGGVCFEKVQADSFFTWGNAKMVEDTINDHEETMEESLCTGRVLKGCLNTGIMKADREEHSKVYVRFFMSLTLAGLLPQVSALSFETVARKLFDDDRSHAVIIRFIHTQDGEKE